MTPALVRGYSNRFALNDLWGQAFGDDPEFISAMYGCGYLRSEDIFALTVDGRPVAALFLPKYSIRVKGTDLPIRLLSCVTTDAAQRGKGYMSLLIKRVLELVRDDCDGVCVIPVSDDLIPFYERFGFRAAFSVSERVYEPEEAMGNALKLDFSGYGAEGYYDAYYEKYAAEGCVFKTKERFLQAVTEYTHPTQPCEFVSFEGGFAFLQRGVSEITVREWVGEDEKALADTLCIHYHLPVRIQDRVGDVKKPIAMLCPFTEELTAYAETTDLYLNCMYN